MKKQIRESLRRAIQLKISNTGVIKDSEEEEKGWSKEKDID